jgi:hypothetical protein
VKFVVFAIRWIANNLTVPFWMLGHIHLSLNIYDDIVEILASFGMNILVATGFYLDWREHKQNK